MKKILFVLFISGFIISCTGSPSVGVGTGFMGIGAGVSLSNLGFKKKDKVELVGNNWVLNKYLVAEKMEESNDDSEINIIFEEKKIYGNGGINGFFGNYELAEDNNFKSFGPFGMTRMAGPEIAMKQEDNFVKLLGEVSSYKIEDNNLYLLDKEGKELLVFDKKDNK